MVKYHKIEKAGIPIVYTAEYSKAAKAMAEAVEKTVAVVERHWNLSVPRGCEVHVLTNLEAFIDQTVPRHLRFLVNLSKPLWRSRAQRSFSLAGGWMLPWRGHPSVGVKPPELLAQVKSGLGDRLFIPVTDPWEKVLHLTCHEFTHACTAHLRLPPWLNEGLAMRAVDHMVGQPTVLEETRSMVQFDPSVLNSRSYRRVKPGDFDALIRLYATGYWITRQLEDENPVVLAELLKQRRSSREITSTVEKTLQRGN